MRDHDDVYQRRLRWTTINNLHFQSSFLLNDKDVHFNEKKTSREIVWNSKTVHYYFFIKTVLWRWIVNGSEILMDFNFDGILMNFLIVIDNNCISISFQGFQRLSRLPRLQGVQGFQRVPKAFKGYQRLQRLSKAFNDFQRLSKTFKGFQRLSKAFKAYEWSRSHWMVFLENKQQHT